MNKEWLLNNADYPIRYSLTQDSSLIEKVMANEEVKAWTERLSERVSSGNLSDIHGSHDYRYENIAGKCFMLGLNSKIPQFGKLMRFFVDFLDRHISQPPNEMLTFGKMYHYRDYETVMACYMPFLGYADEKSVRYTAEKRANIIYGFTKQMRYDVYRNDLAYPGVKKEWKSNVLDPELYKDGNIAFPLIHDLILFAGMYEHFDDETKEKVETTVRWIFGEDYSQIRGLYFYAPQDPSYKAKSIDHKIILADFDAPVIQPENMKPLLFQCYIFSHFAEARKSDWFSKAIDYLEEFKTDSGRYLFPKELITEQKDNYVHSGGHMNAGESKKNKNYAEILSTYYMEKILYR
jgi:hypothetical protein